jgi:predicted nucleic acid-binding protein
MSNILTDSCFWFALYDERDEHYSKAQKLAKSLDFANIILPYPILYETLNTRFCKAESIHSFNEILKKEKTILIPDDKYRDIALNITLRDSVNKKRPMSLVDMIIRLMLDDVNLKIDTLITFNTKDFIDLCYSKNIELISDII